MPSLLLILAGVSKTTTKRVFCSDGAKETLQLVKRVHQDKSLFIFSHQRFSSALKFQISWWSASKNILAKNRKKYPMWLQFVHFSLRRPLHQFSWLEHSPTWQLIPVFFNLRNFFQALGGRGGSNSPGGGGGGGGRIAVSMVEDAGTEVSVVGVGDLVECLLCAIEQCICFYIWRIICVFLVWFYGEDQITNWKSSV